MQWFPLVVAIIKGVFGVLQGVPCSKEQKRATLERKLAKAIKSKNTRRIAEIWSQLRELK